MVTDDKIRDEKLQCNINGESFGKIDQSRVIEQAKFTYSTLGKALEKQLKTIEDQG